MSRSRITVTRLRQMLTGRGIDGSRIPYDTLNSWINSQWLAANFPFMCSWDEALDNQIRIERNVRQMRKEKTKEIPVVKVEFECKENLPCTDENMRAHALATYGECIVTEYLIKHSLVINEEGKEVCRWCEYGVDE